jgi:hypothetical protein
MFSPWTPCNRETTMAEPWNLSAPPVTQLSERELAEIAADEARTAAEWQHRRMMTRGYLDNPPQWARDEHERQRQEAEKLARERTAERGALEADPAAMAALRLLAEGPHPTRALTEVLDDLRPPF